MSLLLVPPKEGAPGVARPPRENGGRGDDGVRHGPARSHSPHDHTCCTPNHNSARAPNISEVLLPGKDEEGPTHCLCLSREDPGGLGVGGAPTLR